MRRDLIISLLLLSATAGCAGPAKIGSGATGPMLPAGSSVALIGTSAGDDPLLLQAQQDVIAALTARGHAVADGAPARIEIGLTDRLASTGIGIIGGDDLSPAKKRKFLQSCKDRTYRMVLTYYGAAEDVPVTSAWAEEHRCRSKLETSIKGLADKAVLALAGGTASETSRIRRVSYRAFGRGERTTTSSQSSSASGSVIAKVAP